MADASEKVSLILTSTNPSGTVKQKSFTDISPDATNAELLAFSRAVNNLTNNTYGRTDKVTKIHVDSDPSGGKQTPTFTLGTTSVSYADFKASATGGTIEYSIPLTYDGDGKIFANIYCATVGDAYRFGASTDWFDNNGQKLLWLYARLVNNLPVTITSDIVITYRTEETDTFKSVEAVFTITP